jgi:predicted nucleic acid-binding protein
MSRVYWDTMLFIYWLEDNPEYAKRVSQIRSRMKERRDQLLTGAFTFGEVLAGVYRRRNAQRAAEVRGLLQAAVAEILPFDLETADHYAQIRASLEVTPADAMHLAAAAHAGTDLFLTNDNRLVGKFVPGIQFIASLNDNVI